MNVMPVASFLKDFSDCLPEPIGFAHEVEPVDNTEIIEAARAEGIAQGREEALAEMEVRFGDLEAAFEARLRHEREAWVSQDGAQLAAAILQGLHSVRDEVVAATADVLKPFLVERARQAALSQLAQTIDDMLLRDPEIGFVISGPQDLLKVLELQLSERAGSFTFKPGVGPEVEVKAGPALLSTRLGAWIEKIGEA